MATVELIDLTKRFGGNVVVDRASLSVADGEFVVLVGPSGCGKSTTLRMIAGLEGVSGGEIRIGGERVNETPPGRRDLAMVFQSYALYPHMSVAENMGFSLRCAGEPAEDIGRRVAEAAEILGLTGLLERRPSQLSGGQRQRVALGRAMVRQPKGFLFDEPLSNLDAALRAHMRAEIRLLRQRMGTTSIYVTHDQVEAMTLGDRIVVMNAGRIVQVGAPLDVYEHPNSRFVGAFLGSPPMNFLSGRVEADGVRVAGARIAIMAGLGEGAPLSVGIRPEHIVLHAGAAPVSGDQAVLAATILLTEQHGGEMLADVAVGDDVVKVSRLSPSLNLGPGTPVTLSFPRDRIRLFGEDGEALAR